MAARPLLSSAGYTSRQRVVVAFNLNTATQLSFLIHVVQGDWLRQRATAKVVQRGVAEGPVQL